MNFTLLIGKPIRLMYVQRDPTLRKTGLGNIFIKNVDPNIDSKSLYDTFSPIGEILSCKIETDENGKSKGYGFIHFADQKSAERAIKIVNGMDLNGKKLYVGSFIPKSQRPCKSEQVGFTNLYVKNFGEDLSEEDFADIFRPYGKITSHKIVYDEQGQSKGFGFVSFESSESAANALKECDGVLVNGKLLYVSCAQKKSYRQELLKDHFKDLKIAKKERGLVLYVKYLDDSIDDERFCQLFSPFGTIASGKIMKENGRSRGFGFITYSLPKEASRAIAAMNGKIVCGKPLYVSLAQDKDERAAAIQQIPFINMQPIAQPVMYQTSAVYQNQVVPTAPSKLKQRIDKIRRGGTLSTLSEFSSEERRQFLGQKLYPKIEKFSARYVAKITGMILEMDDEEILELLNNELLLKKRVEEGYNLLKLRGYCPNN